MQRHVSLNGVRAFEATARLRSLKAAATELAVTPSAVSHQIRQLEEAVGTKLFVRRHNAVELTPEGTAFFEDVAPAIRTIARARQALQREAASVVVKTCPTFGIRWLIPRLPDFHARHPRIHVSVETANPPVSLAPGVDIALPYVRKGGSLSIGEPLLTDRGFPVKAPALRESAAMSERQAKLPFPIVAATADDWDWRFYTREMGIDDAELRIVGRFDTDDAALIACRGGLGVSMQTEAFIGNELASGAVKRIPGFPAVVFGEYWLVVAQPIRRTTDLFALWLRQQAECSAELSSRADAISCTG